MPGVPSQPAPASHPESAVLIAKNSKSLGTWVQGLQERGLRVYVYPSEQVPDGAVLPDVEVAYLGELILAQPGGTGGMPLRAGTCPAAAAVPCPSWARSIHACSTAPLSSCTLPGQTMLPPCRCLVSGHPGEDQPAQPEGHPVHGGRRQLCTQAARPEPPTPRVPRHRALPLRAHGLLEPVGRSQLPGGAGRKAGNLQLRGKRSYGRDLPMLCMARSHQPALECRPCAAAAAHGVRAHVLTQSLRLGPLSAAAQL